MFVSGIRRLSQVANFRVAAMGFHAKAALAPDQKGAPRQRELTGRVWQVLVGRTEPEGARPAGNLTSVSFCRNCLTSLPGLPVQGGLRMFSWKSLTTPQRFWLVCGCIGAAILIIALASILPNLNQGSAASWEPTVGPTLTTAPAAKQVVAVCTSAEQNYVNAVAVKAQGDERPSWQPGYAQ